MTDPSTTAPTDSAANEPAAAARSFRFKADPGRVGDLVAQLEAIAAEEARPKLAVRVAHEIAAQPVEWLWPGRIALGKLSLIAGLPGLGKSQLTAFLAAAVTNNRPLPCGEGQAHDGEVIILSAEDDAADTIRPRLDAAGADPDRVYIVSSVRSGEARRAFSLQADLALLEDVIERSGTRLVVIDPISSYLGRVDSHKNAEVRGVLEPLAELAARKRVAIVAVTHFSKGAAARAIDRVTGSIAFVAAARSAFMIVRDPNEAERRLFVPIKSNVAGEGSGLAFRIAGTVTGNVPTSVVMWDEEKVEGSADDTLAAISDADKRKSARMEAEEFLRKFLSETPVPVSEIRSAADAAGVTWAAVRRTQKAMGVLVRRQSAGNRGAGQWTWSLAPISPA